MKPELARERAVVGTSVKSLLVQPASLLAAIKITFLKRYSMMCCIASEGLRVV